MLLLGDMLDNQGRAKCNPEVFYLEKHPFHEIVAPGISMADILHCVPAPKLSIGARFLASKSDHPPKSGTLKYEGMHETMIYCGFNNARQFQEYGYS